MKQYPTSLTDSQWEIINKIQDDQRKRKHSLRQLWDAILYVTTSGIQWRMLPNDFMPWQTVYYYFAKWRDEGLIEEVHDALLKESRLFAGRSAEPSLGIVDSQSVKTTRVASLRGFDGNKKVKGRKRHIVVDVLGLIIAVVVTAADVGDREGAMAVFQELKGKSGRLLKIIADQGYTGEKLLLWVTTFCNFVLEIVVKKGTATGFTVLPKRWIVERTFSWFENSRRLAKDYERLPETSVAMIHLTMIRIMIPRVVNYRNQHDKIKHSPNNPYKYKR